MQLAYILYKYFPFGGLQRDFLRIALATQARGHTIRVYTLEWSGEVPPGFEVCLVPVSALSHVRRNQKFERWVASDLAARPADRVIGFNKMAGLDVYFAADSCFEEKARTQRPFFYRLTSRYRHFAANERAVFAPASCTEILMISPFQQAFFEKYYATPAARFHLLPPGISADRRAPANAAQIRAELRRELSLSASDLLLLQIGSGFKTKGLDRSLKALASLPPALRTRTRLIVIGKDDASSFIKQSKALGIAERVTIIPGSDEVPRYLLAADLLIHPAYNENTGTVLLEALVAGLPVLTTAVCGYAHYVEASGGGRVVAEPFEQGALDAALARLLEDAPARARHAAAALSFAAAADIYSNAERAADLILAAR